MAYYSDELIDEIINTTDIVQIINEYVPLKRRGANYLGLCPFHKEKTPSFTVSQDKQIYKCFGCGQGGSVIQFISKLENMDFRETLEFLAEKSRIDLSRYEIASSNKSGAIERDKKEIMFNINKETAKYFYEALIEEVNDSKSLLKQYLDKRDLDGKTVKRFGLGYGNKKDISLMTYLNGIGFENKDILSSGVVAQNMKGNIYENFKGRLIFPIFDTRDRVIGFGGRVLDNSLPKYVNSPENIVYHKGSNLYGLNIAKKESFNNLVIVEGYMDVIALHKSGITNAVASLGTALTEKQAKLLKKYTDTVVIAYDGDDAGQAATLKAIDILYNEQLKVKILKLDYDDIKDPDEYINKYGKERLENCIKNSISQVEYKIEKLEKNLNVKDFDSKVEFLSKVANILALIENNIERDMYCELIANKYNIGKAVISSEINKKIKKLETQGINVNVEKKFIQKRRECNLNLRRRQEEYIIALLISKDKKIIDKVFNRFSDKDFEFNDIKEIFLNLKEASLKEDISKINITTKYMNSDKLEVLTGIMCLDLSEFDREKLFLELDKIFKKYSYIKRREEILNRLNSSDIVKDERQLLELELSQIIIKMGKIK